MFRSFSLLPLLLLGFVLAMTTARTDEGMWLLNEPPRQILKERYNFDLTDAWLERAVSGSVRFNNGGSGGFVSPDGLIVTNHHIAADALQKLSSSKEDLFALGFLAKTRAEERKCPDLELNVLQSIEDVTARVNASVKPGMKISEAAAARKAILGEIEKESTDKTGLRSDVVTLYQGGAYHLYRYKKYTDVRLVFAPEAAIASFGGDVDNFEYPRHSLDVAFFRAYEDGKPAAVKHFFKWSKTGPAEGDLVFVTGHPGTTNRLETLARLKHRRDYTLPYSLYRLRTFEAALSQYSEQGTEQRRQAGTDLHRLANARKAMGGQLQGLLDPQIMENKRASELAYRMFARGSSGPSDWFHSGATKIADIQLKFRTFEKEHALLERGDAFFSEYFAIARHLVRMADEMPKQSGERLREYRDSNLESLKFQLFSPAPIDAELEQIKLQTSLTFLAENLGGEHPIVRMILAGKNPAQRASELVKGCKLGTMDERNKLFKGGMKAVSESKDPMIQLTASIDAAARELRKRYENEVEEPERQAYAEIAKARFEVSGRNIAPDATFTLRLAFGTAKGYELDGNKIPFQTTFAGAFERSEKMHGREPFNLPNSWVDNKAKLDLATPFDFASTSDTIGGNSGSPVLNREGQLVGVNFDRNRHGLVRNFVYTEVQARHVSVHCRAVLEALRVIYKADKLLDELEVGS